MAASPPHTSDVCKQLLAKYTIIGVRATPPDKAKFSDQDVKDCVDYMRTPGKRSNPTHPIWTVQSPTCMQQTLNDSRVTSPDTLQNQVMTVQCAYFSCVEKECMSTWMAKPITTGSLRQLIDCATKSSRQQ